MFGLNVNTIGWFGSSGGGGGGTITGGGTLNYVAKFTGATAIGNSLIFDDGTSVGIGTNTPDLSALLDITSTTQGVAMPRMTTLQRNAIAAPVTSLLIFNTSTNLYNYWDGAAWVVIEAGAVTSEWELDGNTNGAIKYIGTNDAFDFPIYTNGVEVARFTDIGGYFGINTTTPTEKLHVVGNAIIDGKLTVTGIIDPTQIQFSGVGIPDATKYEVGFFGTSLYYNTPTGSDMDWQINSVSKMFLDSAGQLGIGTTAPLAPLDIRGGNFLSISSYFIDSAGNNGLALGFGAGLGIVSTNGGATDMTFNINWATEWMRLTASGNFGIGTTTPSGKFNVVHITEGSFELLDNGYLKNVGINGAYFDYDQNSGLLNTVSTTHTRTGFHAQNSAGGSAFVEMVSGGGKSYFNTDSYIEWYANNTGILSARMDSVGKWGFLLNTGIGTISIPGNVRLSVVGVDATSANYAMNVTDNVSGSLFAVRNDGYITFNSAVNLTSKPGNNSIFFGNGAGNLVNAFTNDHNIGIGVNALSGLNGGYQSVAIGSQAFQSAVTSGGNVGVGYRVGTNSTGSANALVGYNSMTSSTTGAGNSYLGANTGENGNGNFNTFLGYYAGRYETGSNKLIIDQTDRVTEAASRTSALIYGIYDATPANQILSFSASVGISTIITPGAKLHVFGVDPTTSVNQRLEPVTGVTEDTTGATVNTTTATVTTIQTIAIPLNTGLLIETYVTGRKTGGAGAGTTGGVNGYVRTVKVKNVGGVVTMGTIQSSYTSEDIAAFNTTLAVSGTNIIVRVAGAVNDNVTWNVITKTYKIS